MNSSSFRQGDVVVAAILFSEQIGAKTRPALVISNSDYNQQSEDIVLLKITSQEKTTAYDVKLAPQDLEAGQLRKPSQIMVDNPATAYKKQIQQKIAAISNKKLEEVKQKMKQLYVL